MSKYLLKLCVAGWVLWIGIKLLIAVTPDPTPHYSSYSYGSDHRSSGYSGSSSYRTPTPTPRPATVNRSTATTSRTTNSSRTTSNSSRTASSSRTYTGSYTDRDVDDYDVDGFYYDNRGDFENEDDAWDYLEDEPDDWD